LAPTGRPGGSHRLRTTARPPHPRGSPPARRPPLGCRPPVAFGAAPGEHPGLGRAPRLVGAALQPGASPGPAAFAHAPPSHPGPPRQGESAARV